MGNHTAPLSRPSAKTDIAAWSYIYDGENRLTQVAKNSMDILDNVYDGSGMRVKQVKDGQTTYYIYQGNNPITEYSLSDGKYAYFIYSGNKLIADEKDDIVGIPIRTTWGRRDL